MNTIERKYSNSLEYQQNQLRAAVYDKFNSTDFNYDIIATFPDENIIMVKDWSKQEYYEIPYTVEEDQITLGDPKTTEHDEMFITKEQIVNSMKQKEPFILLNSETKNPVYRLLVQTPDELPAHDMGLKGIDTIQYSEEGMKEAISKLDGKFVYDDSQSNHSRIRNPQGNKNRKQFAQIVNTGYCPNYGAYTDWEIFDQDYVPLIEQALNSRQKGLDMGEGPSTEIIPKSGTKNGNTLLLTDFEYNGINWDKNPRDKSTGVCSVVLNSLPEKIGGNNVTDEEIVKINKTEYDELVNAKSELDELKPQHEQLKTDYADGEKEFKKVKDDRDDMFKQMVPVWTKQGELKTEMLNSIMEKIPESEREAKRPEFEKMDIKDLENVMILNSMEAPTGDGGVLGGGAPPGNPAKEMTDLEKRTAAALEKRGKRKGIVKR